MLLCFKTQFNELKPTLKISKSGTHGMQHSVKVILQTQNNWDGKVWNVYGKQGTKRAYVSLTEVHLLMEVFGGAYDYKYSYDHEIWS